MTNLQQPRRRALTSLVLATSMLLGGVAVMLTTSAGPAAAASCGTGQTSNTVAAFGNDYLDTNSPTVNFTISSTRISWSLVKGASQTGGTASYQQGATSVSSSSRRANITTSKGKLLTLVVCTTTPVTSSSTSSTTSTTTVPSSTCSDTEVRNSITLAGNGYNDDSTPTLDVTSRDSSSTLSWRLVTGVSQVRATAIYEGAIIKAVSGSSVAKSTRKPGYSANLRLLLVTICTTAPPS